MHTPHVLSGGRYPVLRSLAIIYVIGAGLAVISTVVGVGYALFGTDFAWTDKLIIALGALTAGFFLVLTMLAIAEVLKLFIDVEHNTRMSAVSARPAMVAAATPDMVVVADNDGAGRANRLHSLDEETAEAALLRGH